MRLVEATRTQPASSGGRTSRLLFSGIGGLAIPTLSFLGTGTSHLVRRQRRRWAHCTQSRRVSALGFPGNFFSALICFFGQTMPCLLAKTAHCWEKLVSHPLVWSIAARATRGSLSLGIHAGVCPTNLVLGQQSPLERCGGSLSLTSNGHYWGSAPRRF